MRTNAPIGKRALALLVAASWALGPLLAFGGDSNVVARVGATDMSADAVRGMLTGLSDAERAALARDPAQTSRMIRALLIEKLVLQEALSKKWDQDPGVVARLQRFRDATLVETYLDSVSAPPADYPSEAELKAAYDANRAAFAVPRQYRLAQIFIGAPQSPNKAEEEKAQARLDAVLRQVHRPEADFAAIARSSSEEAASAARGGEIGWVAENRLQPEIRLRVIGQPKDVVTEPIRMDDGWHIVKVLDTQDAHTASLPEVREQLVRTLRTDRAKSERQAYLARLLQQSPISINELAVSGVLGSPGK